MNPKTKTKFKQTEIGMIPEDWEEATIGDFCSVNNGKSNSQDAVLDGAYPFFDRSMSVKRSNRYLFDGDAIIIPGEGKEFIPRLFHGKFDLHQRAYAIQLKEKGKLDIRYLYYWIMKNRERLSRYAVGSTVKSLRLGHLIQFPLFFPKLEEQRAIAKILSDLDSKIELNQQMNKTLEAIGQALFKRWFVDFEFPNEKGKPYKSSGGEMVYNEELGKKIPKGWKVGRLGGFVSVIKGCSYKNDDLKESKIALVTLRSINRGGGFNQEGYKEYVGGYNEEQVIRNGEIVVAQTDLTQKAEVIGRPAIVNSSLGKYTKLIASLDLQIVRPKNNFSKNYLYYLLRTEDFHNHALSYTGGTTVLHLNKNAIPEFLAIIPSKEILDKFDKILEAIQNKIVINESESLTLSAIRDSLLPKLMSGKIRVPIEVKT